MKDGLNDIYNIAPNNGSRNHTVNPKNNNKINFFSLVWFDFMAYQPLLVI